MAQAASSCPSAKRRRLVLSVEDKLDILKLIEAGTSHSIIADRYGIGKSTVGDIKKNKSRLEVFKKKTEDMGMKKACQKVMKFGEYKELDEALHIWFRQQRELDHPVSGVILQEKARVLFEQLYPESEKTFTASTGFLWRFCRRHGLRSVSIQGEQVSADIVAACDFQFNFGSIIEGYNHHQVFNCDETGLQYRMLPRKTLVSFFEKRANGRKKAKERVTLSACANVTGSIKLPLLMIGKYKKPRCFKEINMDSLPVTYRNQTNAWVNTTIFLSWFQDIFVPYVQNELRKMNLEPKAILILDNCSAHPSVELLVSPDGLVTSTYLPPNVTSLVQPMDQGVLESLKRGYRKSLLRDHLLSEDGLLDIDLYLKKVNMKVVLEKVAIAWEGITPRSIRNSWNKLIPPSEEPSSMPSSSDTSISEGEQPESIGSIGESTDERPCSDEELLGEAGFVSDFETLGFELAQSEVQEWLNVDANDQGYQHLDDQGIVSHVLNSQEQAVSPETDSETEDLEALPACSVKHKEAMEMFDKCLSWLQHQPEASSYNTSVLLSLRELAAKKRAISFKQQTLASYLK